MSDIPTEINEVSRDDAQAGSNTYAYSPDVLLKIYWLQKRNNFLLAVEDYQKRKMWGARAPTIFVYSRLYSLWLDLKPALKRRWKDEKEKKKLNEVEKLLSPKSKFSELMKAFEILNDWLDEVGVTKVDTRRKYENKNPEDENRKRGY